MNVARLKERLEAKPFTPFAICTSDGREHAVRSRLSLLVTDRLVAAATSTGGVATLDSLHVVAICDLPPDGDGPARAEEPA